MSETVHYKGKLIPTGKTMAEFDPEIEDIDMFEDHYYEKAIIVNGLVYEIKYSKVYDYEDIFTSSKNSDGSISFEVKYYNGGCCLGEAIEEALDSL